MSLEGFDDGSVIIIPAIGTAVGAQLHHKFDKALLTTLVNKHNSTPAGLALAYGFKAKTISEWARRQRNGEWLKNGNGRPKLLDDKSIDALRTFHRENIMMSKDEFRHVIRMEYIESMNRRAEIVECHLKVRKMSTRTVIRYVEMIYNEVV